VTRTAEAEDRTLRFTAGYGTAGWADRGSGDGSGIGRRVGFHHKTLTGFLQAFAQAGLNIRSVREFLGQGGVVLPWDLAVMAERP
jgi:hypothetical protein